MSNYVSYQHLQRFDKNPTIRMTYSRITNYNDAGEKMQKVIDYCARYAVVPRQSDDPKLPAPWKGVSTEEVKEGIQEEFGAEVANGTATYTWQRLGADNDLNAALSFLEKRREALLDAGLRELSG